MQQAISPDNNAWGIDVESPTPMLLNTADDDAPEEGNPEPRTPVRGQQRQSESAEQPLVSELNRKIAELAERNAVLEGSSATAQDQLNASKKRERECQENIQSLKDRLAKSSAEQEKSGLAHGVAALEKAQVALEQLSADAAACGQVQALQYCRALAGAIIWIYIYQQAQPSTFWYDYLRTRMYCVLPTDRKPIAQLAANPGAALVLVSWAVRMTWTYRGWGALGSGPASRGGIQVRPGSSSPPARGPSSSSPSYGSSRSADGLTIGSGVPLSSVDGPWISQGVGVVCAGAAWYSIPIIRNPRNPRN